MPFPVQLVSFIGSYLTTGAVLIGSGWLNFGPYDRPAMWAIWIALTIIGSVGGIVRECLDRRGGKIPSWRYTEFAGMLGIRMTRLIETI